MRGAVHEPIPVGELRGRTTEILCADPLADGGLLLCRSQIHRRIAADDGPHRGHRRRRPAGGVQRIRRAHVCRVDGEVAAGGLAEEGNAGRVDAVAASMRAYPGQGAADIADLLIPVVHGARGQPVIDIHHRVAVIGEERRVGIGVALPGDETAGSCRRRPHPTTP